MADDSIDDEDSGIVEGVNEASEEAIAQIQAEPVHLPFVPFHLVEKHFNKTTKLLANSGHEVTIDSRNRWHDYDFKKPIFISLARVSTKGFSKHHEFRFKVQLVDGGSKEFIANYDDNNFAVAINEFVTSISFKPPSVFWLNPELNQMMIWGFYKDDISEFLSHFSRIDRLKDEAVSEIRSELTKNEDSIALLQAKEAELVNVQSDIAANQSTLQGIAADFARETQKHAELQAQNSTIASQLQRQAEQIDERKAEIGTLTTGREDIKLEIDRSNAELKKLKENINLFPSEISGFVTQAGNDVKTYMRFAVVLIIVICVLSIWVLSGAFDLSEHVKSNPTSGVGRLLVAKIPSAIGVAALVGACYKISRVFIEEILKINRQKLSLTQVSIIAKDISFSAESNLEFDETEIYALRLRTKMAMLGDHIKTFVPSDPGTLFPNNLFDIFGKTSRNEKSATGQNSSTPPTSDDSEDEVP